MTTPLFDTDQARLVLGDLPATSDEQLLPLIEAATEVIEYLAGPVNPRTVTETVDGGGSSIVLHNTNILTVDSVTIDGTAVNTGTGYTFDSDTGIVYPGTDACFGRFARGIRNVVVTYTTGHDPIPAGIIEAAKEQLRYLWEISQQASRPAFGDAEDVNSAGFRSSTGFSPSGYPIYDRVSMLLAGHRRPRNYAFL